MTHTMARQLVLQMQRSVSLSLFMIIKKKTIPFPEKGVQLVSWFVLTIVLKITKLSYV